MASTYRRRKGGRFFGTEPGDQFCNRESPTLQGGWSGTGSWCGRRCSTTKLSCWTPLMPGSREQQREEKTSS